MDCRPEAVAINGHDRIGTWSAMGPGTLKASRVQDQRRAKLINHRLVGMTKDDAVGMGEFLKHSLFYIVA